MNSEPVTPNSSKSRDSCLSPPTPNGAFKAATFVSPSRSPSTGQLTGIPRKIKDCAADWHNKIQEWRKYRQQGAGLLQDVVNSKRNIMSRDPEMEIGEETDVSARSGCTFPEEVEAHTDDLLAIYASMVKIVEKLQKVTNSLKSISDAERNSDPYFQTWKTYQFHEASQDLLLMYQTELALKETIVHNIAHTSDPDLSMTMVAAWIHEPYIKERADLVLESLLHETGHR